MSADRPVGRRWGGESPGVVHTVLLPAAGHPERGGRRAGDRPGKYGTVGKFRPKGA